MSKRRAQIVLICEDSQHEAFARRFLSLEGWGPRTIRVEKAPASRGSGEQFVRELFPTELQAVRTGHVNRAVIVLIDGDKLGPAQRVSQLDEACSAAGVRPRTPADRVAVAVPTWCIETWLAYLDGQTVDETRQDYRKLSRASECKGHVERLVKMCRSGQLRTPAPDSLVAACAEYTSHIRRALAS